MECIRSCWLVLGLSFATVYAAVAQSPVEAAREAALERPALQLSEEDRRAIVDAIDGKPTYQSKPKDFETRVGAKVPGDMKIAPLPPSLIRKIHSLREYHYVMFHQEILIVDAMRNEVVEVLPRRTPSSGEEETTPGDWADKTGRGMLGTPKGETPPENNKASGGNSQ
jgi:hypothetical protein